MKNKELYDKVNPAQDANQREREILELWDRSDIFKKSIKGNKEWIFFDGPPTANGKPHVGHVLTRVVKDVIPRYKTMKGYRVSRKAGWDTHGLPVELEVEKILGLDGKKDIERYGIAQFVDKCKESVWTYKTEWENMSKRVGYWVDMDDPYITYDDSYIESVWWSIQQIHKKGLLYKGHRVAPYCARCGTSLSSHEVAQGYKDIEDRSVIVAFDCGDNEYIAAWTTTPWTLPSNVALCVNPEFEYALIQVDGRSIWCASALAERYFDEYNIVRTVLGKELVGKSYKPLYNHVDDKDSVKEGFQPRKSNDDISYSKKDSNESLRKSYTGNAYTVVADDFVTLDSGTGIVHIAPAYGEDDSRIGTKNNLPFVQMVNEYGVFVGGQFEGIRFRQADKHIIKDISSRDLLIKEISYKHSYPHCWRCDQPLMYFARSAWFVAMSKLRHRLGQINKKIKWHPSHIGAGRMGNFLSNVIDWSISRERYWGTPLPIWQCECGNIKVVSGKAELYALTGSQDVQLHKPFVDKVVMQCHCGSTMHRTPEVLDCWYDSGSMPFAQHHYPYATHDIPYQADFISEAIDQTRGWFYTLIAISTVLFDKPPFKNCVVLGHVLDKNGVKMSKHKGNVVGPHQVLDVHGADAVRWHFLSSSAPHLPSRFGIDMVGDSSRRLLGTLWNVYSFYVLYGNIDRFDPSSHKLVVDNIMDRWILSQLHNLIQSVDSHLNKYRIVESARMLADFCDLLSNWYIRRCRERFWSSQWTQDKVSAYMTLYTVLHTTMRLAAPFVPFMTESMWQNIVRRVDSKAEESVHLSRYPRPNKRYLDAQLNTVMQVVLHIVENGRAARSLANIKNRQPLATAYIAGVSLDTGVSLDIGEQLTQVVREELNVKQIQWIDGKADFVTYECKPQLRTLGARYKENLNTVRQYLEDNADLVVEFFESNPDGVYLDRLGELDISFNKNDVLVSIKSKEGYACGSGHGMVVALDSTLTQSLIEEGIVREIVSKVQAVRKDSNLEVTDRIRIAYNCSRQVADVIDRYSDVIAIDVLADSIEYVASIDKGLGRQVNINGHNLCIALQRAEVEPILLS